MKKEIIYFLFIIAMIFIACDPIEDRDTMKGSVSADELEVSVTPVVIDGQNTNKIVMSSNNDVLFRWNYGLGLSQEYNDTVLLVLTGDQTITYTVQNGDGSQTNVEKTVTVDTLYFPVPPQWGYLCGTGEKTWTWDDTQPSSGANSGTSGPVVWGNGGYMGCTAPCWWNVSLADVDTSAPGEGEGATMVFSISNGAALVKNYTDGTSESGSFSFDMDEIVSEGWDIGTLYTSGVTVLAGFVINQATDAYEYSILSLDDDYMSLSVPIDGAGSWGEATFWMFKAEN